MNRTSIERDILELSEAAVYDIDEREYVRKAEVDEECKETRLQGLKDHLARSDEPKTDQLRTEIAELEQRIEDLTESAPGRECAVRSSVHTARLSAIRTPDG